MRTKRLLLGGAAWPSRRPCWRQVPAVNVVTEIAIEQLRPDSWAAEAMGLEQVLITPRSPWQSPYVERLIGSVRRECLDHIIVLNRAHLHRILQSYFTYYHSWRTHLGLNKDAPENRRVQSQEEGNIITFPELSGLHHHYERRAA